MSALTVSPSCWSKERVARALSHLTDTERGELDRLLCIEDRPLSLRSFIRQVKPRYQWYPHCELLAAVLQRVADGELRRVMVFLPPRHSKSETVSRLFPAYYLYRHPGRWVGLNSYAADLAYTLSRAARENYQAGGGPLKDSAAAVKHWETLGGGGLWAAGVGGPITGKGFHLGIIDDPLKNAEEAASTVIREKQKEWWRSTFYTREEPEGAIVIVQTRWHDDDLSGWLLTEDPTGDGGEAWHIVNLPALYEAEVREWPPLCAVEPDFRREPGAALCPDRYPGEHLRKIEVSIGPYYWNALYQQRPRPHEGLMFQRGFFQPVGAAPAIARRVRYWDKASAAPGKGDWTAGVLMARTAEGLYFVEDVVRGQWPSSDRNRNILATAHQDRRRYGQVSIYIEQPPGLAKESTEDVIRVLDGFPVTADPVMKDKVERAEPFASQARAGNVRLVVAPWNAAYLAEMEAFPMGTYDDQVDATSGAHKWLSQPVPGLPRSGGSRPALAQHEAIQQRHGMPGGMPQGYRP